VKNYIEPGIGARRLDHLRVSDVQAWLNRLAAQCQCCAEIRHTQQDEERDAAGETWQQTKDMPSLIFTGRYGTPIDPRTLNRRCVGRCDAAGVRPITVHDARHTCATLVVDLDVHPRVIMRILRHADQAVTMEIYANASSAATREALRRLGETLH
jgi:integrase